MFCNNCGKEIANNSLFCTNCGNKIKNNIPPVTPPTAASPPTPSIPDEPQPIQPQSTAPQQTASAPAPATVPQQTAPAPQQTAPQAAPQTVSQSITPPPTTSNNTALEEKKKNKLLLPLIIVGALLVIAIGVIVVLFFRKNLFNRNDIETDNNKGRNLAIEDKDEELEDMAIDDNDGGQLDDFTEDMGLDISDGLSLDSSDEVDATDTELIFELRYNYTELPDVLSIDSDSRFSYVDYYSLSDSYVYSFQFNEENATEAGFYNACEEYSLLLQESYGFTYELDYSEQKYAESGLMAHYLTKDNYAISITASVEDLDYFAYITIYLLADEVEGGNVNDENITAEFDMPNYNYFLANRDTISFTYGHEVSMDNGLAFNIYEAMGNHTDDGNVVMDVKLDISSYYSDYYFNNGDFFMIPLDLEGNVLSDAVPIAMVLDEAGNEVTMPFQLSASSYDNYTFYFPVPNETYTVLLYATNVLVDDYSYPAYVMHVGN